MEMEVMEIYFFGIVLLLLVDRETIGRGRELRGTPAPGVFSQPHCQTFTGSGKSIRSIFIANLLLLVGRRETMWSG